MKGGKFGESLRGRFLISRNIYMRKGGDDEVKAGRGNKRIGLYNVIVHPHRYLRSEIGLIVVYSSSLSSSLPALSICVFLLIPKNKGGGVVVEG